MTALAIDAPSAVVAPPDRRQSWRVPATLFVGIALLLAVVVWQSSTHLPRGDDGIRPRVVADSVLGGWLRYDAVWYVDIANHGYFYAPGQQSSVAFFPSYPLTVRAASHLTGDTPLAAMLVTFLSGLGVALLFWRWCRDRLSPPARRVALALLLVYPYAWYLYGTGYADALYLAAALGAFVLLESGHPVLAGIAGAVATAARPVGIAVLVGLVVVAACRRRARGERLRMVDAGVLLAGAGIGSWCTYLWLRFGEPIAFIHAEEAPGWDQQAGLSTWFKESYWHVLMHGDRTFAARLTAQAILGFVFLAAVPWVVRRFGWGYGTFTLVAVAVPMLGAGEFQGVGRYLLAAFPVFALIGEALAKRPRLATGTLAVSALTLVTLTSFFARGYYLS
ncbi:MAG: hypothetical protein QOG39_386 [Acidimicrobiaceae bacterium]